MAFFDMFKKAKAGEIKAYKTIDPKADGVDEQYQGCGDNGWAYKLSRVGHGDDKLPTWEVEILRATEKDGKFAWVKNTDNEISKNILQNYDRGRIPLQDVDSVMKMVSKVGFLDGSGKVQETAQSATVRIDKGGLMINGKKKEDEIVAKEAPYKSYQFPVTETAHGGYVVTGHHIESLVEGKSVDLRTAMMFDARRYLNISHDSAEDIKSRLQKQGETSANSEKLPEQKQTRLGLGYLRNKNKRVVKDPFSR